MKKLKFNNKTKNIVLIVLSCIMLFGAIFGLVALFRQDKTTKEISPSYSVGALDHNTGKYVETKSAIYTKEGIECQGLTTSLEFDAVVKYQLFFYSEYDELIHYSGILDGVYYSTDVPIHSKYVRIVIIPNDDENITWLEKNKYANQLNITVNKEQNFKSIGANLFAYDEVIGKGKFLSYSDGVTVEENPNLDLSTKVEVKNKNNVLCLTFAVISSSNIFGIYTYDKNGDFLSYVNLMTEADKIYHVSSGVYSYLYELSSSVGYVRILTPSFSTPELYLF